MDELLKLIAALNEAGLGDAFQRFAEERGAKTEEDFLNLARTFTTMVSREPEGLLRFAKQGGVRTRDRVDILRQSMEGFGRNVAAGGLRGVTSVTSGLFDLLGADQTAEGIRESTRVVTDAILPEPSDLPGVEIPGLAGNVLGELTTMLVPFVGAGRAGAAAARLLDLGRKGTLVAEGVAQAPLAMAIATDPELSWFASLPERDRVAIEGLIEAGSGPALALAAVPFRVGKNAALRLRRFNGAAADVWAKTNVPGAERRRLAQDPRALDRANFYIAGTGEPEGFIGIRSADYVHDADIPADRLYPIAEDPDGIVARVQHELGNLQNTNFNRLEDAIKDAGYLGYYEGPGTGDVATRAVLFDTPEARRALSTVESRPNPLLPANIDRAAEAADVARRYSESRGLTHEPQAPLGKGDVDDAFHTRIAEVYEDAVNTPNDPQVRAAYEAMEREVRDQFEWLTRSRLDGGAGMKVTFTTDDPYTLSKDLFEDIEVNGHFRVFATPDDHHPIISQEANNMFRAVHDYFGHYLQRNTFAGHGEESAARLHSLMFTDEARPAMLTETRGQNSWFNQGPHRDLPARERPFAEQKAFLLPEWARGPEYVTPPPKVSSTRLDSEVASAHAEFGGSTFDGRTGANMVGQDRWAVAAGEPELLDSTPTPEDIARFREANADALAEEGATVATWNNHTREDGSRILEGDDDFVHGMHEINVGRTFDNMDDALEFGRDRGEASFLNLADEEFEAVHFNDTLGQARLRARLDDTIPERSEARAKLFMSLLTPDELRRFQAMNRPTRERALRNFSLMPTTREGMSAALVGAQAEMWYASSADAIVQAFGEDAPRFSALLASTSANAPVDNNLRSALRMWGEWDRLGRPTGAEEIRRIFKEFAEPEGAVTNAADNAVAALTMTDAQLLDPEALQRFTIPGDPSVLKPDRGTVAGRAGKPSRLSGPKVDPFYANLMGYVQRITVDTHMLRGVGANINTSVSGPRKLGINAHIRLVARELSKATGRTITPAQVQAMQWATFKTLSDRLGSGAQRRGKTIAEAVENFIFEGGPVPALRGDIDRLPSFASLMADPELRPFMDAAGANIPEIVPPTISADFDPGTIREADIDAVARRMDAANRGEFLFQLGAMASAGAAAALLSGEEEAALLAAGIVPAGRRLDWQRLGTAARRVAQSLDSPIGRESELAIRGLDETATIDVERLRRSGNRYLPAFLDEESGKTFATGIAHDPHAIQDPALRQRVMDSERVVDGFYDTATGRFLTRDETAKVTGSEIGESSIVRQAEQEGGGAGSLDLTPEELEFLSDLEAGRLRPPGGASLAGAGLLGGGAAALGAEDEDIAAAGLFGALPARLRAGRAIRQGLREGKRLGGFAHLPREFADELEGLGDVVTAFDRRFLPPSLAKHLADARFFRRWK